MNAEHTDAMEMRATAQQYTGPNAGRIASLIPHVVGFERGWFWTTTAICHGGESDGLAFRQRADGNGIDVRCHTGGCTRGHIVTAIEGLVGLPIWTAYEPVSEATAVRPKRRWRGRKAAVLVGGGALLAAPLLLGHGGEPAVLNAAGLGGGALLVARLFAGRRRPRALRR